MDILDHGAKTQSLLEAQIKIADLFSKPAISKKRVILLSNNKTAHRHHR